MSSSDEAGPSSDAAAAAAPAKKKRVRPVSKKQLKKHLETEKNRGVLFISRVPPYLKPGKLRDLLSGMGTEVLRVYLAAEDGAVRARRLKNGGNKKKSFTEGWVEFEDKRKAKRIASTLNNTPMGGGPRSFYQHDLWNIKYLHKFKWHHLTEKIAYEGRVRQDKMRAELSSAKKETSFYLKKVEQAKGIEAMEERKARRAAAAEGDASGAGDAPTRKRKGPEGGGADSALQEVRRSFKQRKVVGDPGGGGGTKLLKGLLGK
jgi:ESF2/ABP1 family protein